MKDRGGRWVFFFFGGGGLLLKIYFDCDLTLSHEEMTRFVE